MKAVLTVNNITRVIFIRHGKKLYKYPLSSWSEAERKLSELNK